MFIRTVCQVLEKEKIPYAVVGGHAVALHGFVRGTVDVDFIVKWNLENLIKVEKALNSIGLKSRLPLSAQEIFNFRNEYIKKRNLIAWNFTNPKNTLEQVDLIITTDLKNCGVEKFHTAWGVIKVIAKKDLIRMKKASGREQDLRDIEGLQHEED